MRLSGALLICVLTSLVLHFFFVFAPHIETAKQGAAKRTDPIALGFIEKPFVNEGSLPPPVKSEALDSNSVDQKYSFSPVAAGRRQEVLDTTKRGVSNASSMAPSPLLEALSKGPEAIGPEDNIPRLKEGQHDIDGARADPGEDAEVAVLEKGQTSTRSSLPRRIKDCPADYPEQAKVMGVEGTVRLRLLVSSDGHVEKVEVMETPGYGLELAAMQAVESCRFHPAEKDGRAVRNYVNYSYEFQLDD